MSNHAGVRIPRFAYRIGAKAKKTFPLFLLVVGLSTCKRVDQKPLTLNYFRFGWSVTQAWSAESALAQNFTQETGIRVEDLPVPENALDQLDLSRKLVKDSSGVDVLGVDSISSGALAGDLLDLRPYLSAEISSIDPEYLSGYTVDGKLVAVPNSVLVGVLQYRADLLREYGYGHPPKTWDELEKMARRIQAGERAKGDKEFWGYVWQGNNGEALTCNALEWQVAEGGGRIVEDDRTISVNNPGTIRAWRRAERWIGTISPPGVVEYKEFDSDNIFDSGEAVFNRVWREEPITHGGRPRQFQWVNAVPGGRLGYTSIPGGPHGWDAVLGGAGLAVSRNSAHPKEAVEFVRALIRGQIKRSDGWPTSYPDASRLEPNVEDQHGASAKPTQPVSEIMSRPSNATGSKYEEVTRAYSNAVHSVLTGKKEASGAAADLEKQLITITGFQTGPPKIAN
jgi:trehalose/maltose transport system substrate-binding protein